MFKIDFILCSIFVLMKVLVLSILNQLLSIFYYLIFDVSCLYCFKKDPFLFNLDLIGKFHLLNSLINLKQKPKIFLIISSRFHQE